MSTHVSGFQPFSGFFASFCIGQISHMQGSLVLLFQWEIDPKGISQRLHQYIVDANASKPSTEWNSRTPGTV